MPDLIGDLNSKPDPAYWMFNSEIGAMHDILDNRLVPAHERPYVEAALADLVDCLRTDLAARNRFQEARIQNEVHHQLRSRPDSLTGKVVVEQWVPALKRWLVSGAFDPLTDTNEIIRQLQAGDPRFKSMADAVAEAREKSAQVKRARDSEQAARVLDTVDALTERARDEFIEVETALHTGETIHVRGDDRRFIEKTLDRTRAAAAQGDVEAQSVLTHGQRDTPLCLNPGDNPLNR